MIKEVKKWSVTDYLSEREIKTGIGQGHSCFQAGK